MASPILPASRIRHARVNLSELRRRDDGRSVAFAMAGDPGGAPILVFYPAGGNRRILEALHASAVRYSQRLICVNRPGKSGTSFALQAGAAAHVRTVVEDAVAVLDLLSIPRVHLLFICAGTPFAFAFAVFRPDRTEHRMLGLAPWLSPADYEDARPIYRFGAQMPSWLISPFIGFSLTTQTVAQRWLPQSLLMLPGSRADADYVEECTLAMRWMCEEEGGDSSDVESILCGLNEIGVAYDQVRQDVTLVHGEKDSVSPVSGAAWLAGKLPKAHLVVIPDGTHESILMLNHAEVADAIRMVSRKKSSFGIFK